MGPSQLAIGRCHPRRQRIHGRSSTRQDRQAILTHEQATGPRSTRRGLRATWSTITRSSRPSTPCHLWSPGRTNNAHTHVVSSRTRGQQHHQQPPRPSFRSFKTVWAQLFDRLYSKTPVSRLTSISASRRLLQQLLRPPFYSPKVSHQRDLSALRHIKRFYRSRATFPTWMDVSLVLQSETKQQHPP